MQSSPNCRATRSNRSGQLCDQSSCRVVNVAVAVARDHSRTSQHHSTSSRRQMSTPALITLFHPPSLPSPSHALHRPPKLLLLLLINCRASHLTRASSVRPTGQTLTLQRVQTIRDVPRRISLPVSTLLSGGGRIYARLSVASVTKLSAAVSGTVYQRILQIPSVSNIF